MIDVATKLREHAEAARASGQERITFSLPWQSAFTVADTIERYFTETRPACFVCDQIRQAPIADLENAVGVLTIFAADLAIFLESIPATPKVNEFRRNNRGMLRASSELIKSVRTGNIGNPRTPGDEG